MVQRTFSIIKPDAVRNGYTGAILAEIDKAGFKIVSLKKASISNAQAQGFYHVHAARPFFADLCAFMSSGPLVLMVLEKENAIADLRKLRIDAANLLLAHGIEQNDAEPVVFHAFDLPVLVISDQQMKWHHGLGPQFYLRISNRLFFARRAEISESNLV